MHQCFIAYGANHCFLFCFARVPYAIGTALCCTASLSVLTKKEKYLCKILKRVKEPGGDLLKGGIISRIYGNAGVNYLST